ncbi:major capsid protein [Streptomyces sp. NBC_00102]|uniref:major capsid protein n=1 Tax=Streptomyces sp. NBC_00102 TaxID=2975652 RepID=UPI0022541D0E|nr:phage major capsid protein [Streptomyces sp. NBC_00102]MCX5398463.1 phage major capsid protein [Streptomyces sp. NBC_00102]
MTLSLSEAAKLSTDDLQRGIIETFVQESPILDRLPLMEIEGNSYAYNSEATLPGVEFRGVNESYSESTGTVNQASESLVILGGDADVDTFIAKTRSNLNDQRALQETLKVKAAAYRFQDAFFNGDVAVEPKGFDGLRKRLIGAQVLSAGTNGMGPVTGGHDFFDALDALIAQVPGLSAGNGALYANRKIIAKIASSARRLGGYEMVQEALTGKRVATYQGIPLLDPGQTAAGADIVPTTETQGTATDASSIYAVKFGQSEGDKGVTGLTNGGVSVRDLGELDSKPAYRTRIEFFCGLAVFGGQAAARLNGVLTK